MDMKTSIFWDITACSPVKETRRFGGTYRVQFEEQAKKETRMNPVSFCPLLSLFFNPEDCSYMFLRNVGSLSSDFMALYITEDLKCYSSNRFHRYSQYTIYITKITQLYQGKKKF
jgi:hypothetical protein